MKLAELNIMNELLKIYIDNVNAVFHPVKAGSEYGDDELQMNEIKSFKRKMKVMMK